MARNVVLGRLQHIVRTAMSMGESARARKQIDLGGGRGHVHTSNRELTDVMRG
jgi:hypothetical protein